jgi:hypothetical protein
VATDGDVKKEKNEFTDFGPAFLDPFPSDGDKGGVLLGVPCPVNDTPDSLSTSDA